MPILAGVTTTPEPPPVVVDPPPVGGGSNSGDGTVVRAPDSRVPAITRPLYEWTSPAGVTVALSGDGDGFETPVGITGLDLPPVQLDLVDAAELDGAVVTASRFGPRDVVVPLRIRGTSPDDCRARKLRLLAAINTTRAPGTLTVRQPDGTARTLTAYYLAGAEGSQERGQYGVYWQRYRLAFRCADPFTYDTQPIVRQWRLAGGGATFPATFPVQLGASQVLGTVEIDNPGDADSYPEWTVTGPGGPVVIGNTTTGEAFTITGSLGTDTLLVDTRPGRKVVRNVTTTALAWSRLGPNPQLWPLRPGPQTVSLAVTGAAAGTMVTMTLRPRYLTA